MPTKTNNHTDIIGQARAALEKLRATQPERAQVKGTINQIVAALIVEIREMRQADYTWREMAEALRERGINVSHEHLRRAALRKDNTLLTREGANPQPGYIPLALRPKPAPPLAAAPKPIPTPKPATKSRAKASPKTRAKATRKTARR